MEQIHLGDGVYASFDGYQIVLEADNNDQHNTIYLEPVVIEKLEAYIKKLRGEN